MNTQAKLENREEAAERLVLQDGAQIQTWVTPGVGIPIVFLYGLGCSIRHWKYQLTHLQQHGRLTIHMDYRGHGQSSLGSLTRPLSIQSLSRDLHEVLDLLRVDNVLIFGQSMGGSIAMQFAHDYPNQCAGLILQGSPGRNPYSGMQIGHLGRMALKGMISMNRIAPNWVRFLNSTAARAPQIVREIVRMKGFNAALARTEDIEEYLQHFFATDPNIFYELAEDLQNFDVTNLANLIEVPVLIIAGAKDRIVPVEDCKWLAKRLPLAELEVIAHGSHCPHLDDPKLVNAKIDRFLATYGL